MKTLKVNLDKKTTLSYDIRIGRNMLDRMVLLIAKNHKAPLYGVITDANVSPLYGERLTQAMQDAGLNVFEIVIPAGESQKTIDTLVDISGRLLAAGSDRQTVLIALGGGVIGDLAGFAASVFMRSVRFIQVPTTLVGQVDSSIGGKTAVDLPQGKNLLGTFHQPAAVFIDTACLDTLPACEFQNGMAEIIKYGVIEDESLFLLLEKEMDVIKSRDADTLLKIIETCCRIKKSIVEVDEREQGLRRILNFGHTIGHALEAVSGYALSHGEGVALGMIAASRLSVKLGYLEAAEAGRIERLIGRADLPTRIMSNTDSDAVLKRLQMDKKKKDGAVRFVLIKKIGLPFANGGIPDDLIRETLEEMKA